MTGNSDDDNNADSAVSAAIIRSKSIANFGNVDNQHPLIVKQSWERTFAKLLKPKKLNTYGCYEMLPFSGLKLEIIQTGKNSFKFKSSGTPSGMFGDLEWEPSKKKSMVLNRDEAEMLLRNLKICQLVIDAISNRLNPDQELCLVPSSLIFATEAIDEMVQCRLGKSGASIVEVNEKTEELENLFVRRINVFIKELNKIANQSRHTLKAFDVYGTGIISFEDKYIQWRSPTNEVSTKYLDVAPCQEVDSHIKYSISDALKRLFLFPKSDDLEKGNLFVHNSHTFSLPRLYINKDEVNPYDSINELCMTIEPHSDKFNSKEKEEFTEIKTTCKGELKSLSLESMLSPKNNPRILKEKIDNLMLENQMEELIDITLEKELPGIHGATDREKYPETLRDTASLRGSIKSLISRLDGMNTRVDNLTSAKDTRLEQRDGRREIQQLQSRISSAIQESTTPEQVEKLLDEIRADVDTFEEKLEGNTKHAKTHKSSVFWVGLGQGGSQILRECLLYCMDNVNDARASSLLTALGLKPKQLIDKMRARNNGNTEDKANAEAELKELCDKYLRVLAVNIGTDIDRLVLPNAPGYFLWGDSVGASQASSVVRKTKNTLRLDAKMGGAGGSTGLGRAFGFARSGEIEQVLADVGNKNNSGNNPSHVIITHSYAGGSGSGMTLPILQHIRKSFDADTVIWVMSVGEGDSEDKDQAVYNTPFIISDVLQAHYDGIHSPVEPVLTAQWKIFKSEMKIYHTELEKYLKELLDLVDAKKSEDMTLMDRYLLALPEQVEIEQRKSDMVLFRQSLGEAVQFNPSALSDETSLDDLTSIPQLLELLPDGDGQTDKFNEWCEEFEDEGSRPALNFWQAWVECASDPIGTYVSGKESVKATQVESTSEEGRRKDFMPSLSEKDLDKVLNQINYDYGVITNVTSSETSQDEEDRITIPVSLQPLYKMLREGMNNRSEDNDKKEYIESIKTIFISYKNRLKSYNNHRKNLTRQIRALTGSSNDERVKNIVISNGHLERGVKASTVKVADNSYTVFNSVIFDLILNIIGSQMPSNGNYMTTSTEEFDEQDLIQHTKSPLAVGLFEHRDSLSLAESSLSHKGKNDYVGDVISEMFLKANLWDGKVNPLFCADTMGGIKYLENSLFGPKALSLLQNNPYDATDLVEEPEKLNKLAIELQERWDSNEQLLKFDKNQRNNIEKEVGFTGLHLGNIVRWISAIDVFSVLPYAVSPQDPNRKNPRESKMNYVNEIKQKLELWKEYCPQIQTYDDSLSKTSRELDDFREESGNVDTGRLKELLPKIGIWNDRMLRSIPPSYINTYLPALILEEAPELLVDQGNKGKIIEGVRNYSIWSNDNKLYGENIGRIISRKTQINSILDNLDLQLVMWTEKTSEGEIESPVIRLHPRLQRYLSALRTLPVSNGDHFLPARSTAGLLPRYVMANELKNTVKGYSIPTFKQATSILNWYRYIGLLPDETRFEWRSLLRMLLLADTDYANLQSRLKHLSRLMGVDLDEYKSEIEEILSTKYSTSGLNSFKIPSEIWDQMTVLHKRMVSTVPLAGKILDNTPESWRDSVDGIKYWITLIEKTNMVDPDANDTEVVYSSSDSVENVILRFQLQLERDTPPSESPELDFSEPIHHVRRLTYDIMTYMREALLQSVYQSTNSTHERVHFEMTGFSDVISGVPGGLLCLVHDKGTKMDKGMVQGIIRSNVHHSIGYINTNKEFSTSSRFGPNATSTIVMMNAPVNEAARQFSLAMDRLQGTSKYAYLNKTKLHPYVFLYNLLWLPTNIDRWIPADNEDYIRRFQIPQEVIQEHYNHPDDVKSAIKQINKESAFKTGGVSVPNDDIRDFKNVKKNGEYRNMTNLIGLMALRHQHNSEEILWEGILEEEEFIELTKRRGRSGKLISKYCLEPINTVIDSVDDDDWDDLFDDEGDVGSLSGGSDGNNEPETIESRGKAWFEAYKNWLHYSIQESDE